MTPLIVTLLEQTAKANARELHAGHACDGAIRCHYYPHSRSFAWWNADGRCNKADVVEHYRFLEDFRRRA